MMYTSSANGRRGGSRTSRMSSRSSRMLPIPFGHNKDQERLTPLEQAMLEAAELGDKHTIIRCMQNPKAVRVNIANIAGQSALQIAVDNENIEIVEVLLKHPQIIIGDALLYAIQEGVYRLVEMLIDHPSITTEMLGTAWENSKGTSIRSRTEADSHHFSTDISPVILAATCNQFEILQLLISRGAKIEKPHPLSCVCLRCKEQVNMDSLRHSLLRINTYRALSSPAWISLTSPDPILTAFKLSWELQRLTSLENEFKKTLMELSEQCRRYACQLLDQCRSSDEVIAVLNRGRSMEDWSQRSVNGEGLTSMTWNNNWTDLVEDQESNRWKEERLTLDRLKLAIKYEQKHFVAHPHCQQLITSIWFDQLPYWRRQPVIIQLLLSISLVFLLPVLALIYLIYPRGRVGQLLRSPLIKFINHSASFATFLLLLLISSAEWTVPNDRYMIRGPTPNALELLIIWWVLGFVWSEVKQLWDEGAKAYTHQWWNWLDFIMLGLYLTFLTLRLVAWLLSYTGRYGSERLSRREWPATDPTLMSEAVFAIANVFSFARIIFLFQVNEHLGPLQISLGCMLIDIAKFIFIFILIITSFACGLNQLYFYFIKDPDIKNEGFTTLLRSYQSLFWSLFGVTQVKDIQILGRHTDGAFKVLESATATTSVAQILLLVYHGMAIIVLVNMLIAMMSNSFQNIQNHADIEWKFARSKLWVGYFDEGCTLPPPLNTIVSPKYLLKSVCNVKNLLVYIFATKRQKSISVRQNVTEGTIKTVMRKLVSRYIHWTKKNMREDGVNEDDILEIKQDISSLRYELREDRKKDVLRSTSHLDSLKTDLIKTFQSQQTTMTSGLPQNSTLLRKHTPPTHLVSTNPFLSTSETSPSEIIGKDDIQRLLRGFQQELLDDVRQCLIEHASPMRSTTLQGYEQEESSQQIKESDSLIQAIQNQTSADVHMNNQLETQL